MSSRVAPAELVRPPCGVLQLRVLTSVFWIATCRRQRRWPPNWVMVISHWSWMSGLRRV